MKEIRPDRVLLKIMGRSFLLFFLLLFGKSFGAHSQRWSRESDLPGEARDDGVCFRIGGKAFCGTGLKVGWESSRDFYAYHPKERSWHAISKMPSGEERQYAVAFSNETMGFVFGGIRKGEFLGDLWRYEPSSDEWREMAELPAEGRSGASCFRIGDTAYVIGGKTDSKQALAEVWSYDIREDEWTQKGKLPFEGRWSASATSVEGKGYILFGEDSLGDPSRSLYEYDPGKDAWERLGKFPGMGRTYSKLWGEWGKLYLLGGMDSTGQVHGDLWRFRIEEKQWKEMVSPPVSGRRGGMGFELCYSLYYTTGLDTGLKRSKESYKLHLPTVKDPPTLKVRPNPTADKVFVAFGQPSFNLEGKIRLIDRRGRTVIERELQSCRFELDLREIPSGLYILRILAGDEPLHKKLIKVDR